MIGYCRTEATSILRLAWPLLLIGFVGLCGCVTAQQKGDDALASYITERLLATDELNLSRIEVSVEGSTVYLSGMSDDHESKVHAEKEARGISGVQRVINKIEVDF